MVRPDSCAPVRPQLPSAFLVPADKLAALGTPMIAIARLSVPSVAVSAEVIDKGTAAPALPDAFAVDKVGAVATPATTTARLAELDDWLTSPCAAAVAVTLSVAVPAKSPSGTVRVRPDNC